MSFDAGSIESRITVDRSPFTRGLDEAKRQAEEFARGSYSARIDLDTAEARAQLVLLRAELDRLNSQRFGPTIQTNGIKQAQANSKEATQSVGLLRTAIEQLGPALIPLAGGLAALGSAAVGFGLAGITAFKTVSSEITATNKEIQTGQTVMRANVQIGSQYAGSLRVIEQAYQRIAPLSARAGFTGFAQGAAELQRQLPSLNVLLSQSGRMLGDVFAHGVDAVVGGLHTFTPLILEAEGYVDRFVRSLDRWANGPAAGRFAQSLAQDLHEAIPLLQNAFTLVSHLIAAINPIGGGQLSLLTQMVGMLARLPTGVLTAFTTAYIAFRTAVAVTSGINAAVSALRGLAVAEGEAAAAGAGGAAGGLVGSTGRVGVALGGLLSRAVPFVAAWAAVAVGLNTASHAMENWRNSANTTRSFLSNWTGATADLLTFNWGDIGNRADAYHQSQQLRAQINLAQGTINGMLDPGRAAVQDLGSQRAVDQATAEYGRQLVWVQGLQQQFRSGVVQTTQAQNEWQAAVRAGSPDADALGARFDRLRDQTNRYAAALDAARAKLRALPNPSLDARAAIANDATANRVAGQYANRVALSNTGDLSRTYMAANAQGVTQAGQALAQYQTHLSQAIRAEQSWVKVTDDHTVSIGKDRFELTAWQTALAQANGNVARAAGILEGHKRALSEDEQQASRVAVQQARLSQVVGQTANRYHLTDQALQTYASAVGVTAKQLATGQVTQRQFNQVIGQVVQVVNNAGPAMQNWLTALQTFDQGADTAASRAALMGQAMVSLQGDNLGFANTMAQTATAAQQLHSDLANLHSGVIDLKTGTIDYHNAAAAPVLNDLQAMQTAAMNAAAATYQHEVATRGVTQASKDAADVFHNQTYVELVRQARQLGLTRGEAQKLADRYFHWPKDARTQIAQLGGDRVQQTLTGILQDLDKLSGGHHITVTMSGTQDVLNQLHELGIAASAIGNGVAIQASPSGSYGSSGRHILAQGGIEEHVAQIAPHRARTVRVWAEPETGGEAYVPLSPAKRERSKGIVQEVVRRFGGTVQFFAGGGLSGVPGSIWNWAKGWGASDAGAAAVVGNAHVESASSGWNKAYNSREGAVGVFQDEGDRRRGVQGYARRHGGTEWALSNQLGFALTELNGPLSGIKRDLQRATDPRQAAATWDAGFERSSGGSRGAREGWATYYYNHGHGQVNTGGGGAGGSSAPPPPPREYRGRMYTSTQSYNEAVAAQHSRGQSGRIVGFGSGANRGWGYDGQSYGSYAEAFNARADRQAQARTINRAALGGAKQELGWFDKGMGSWSAGAIRSRMQAIQTTLDNARRTRAVPDSLVKQFGKDNDQLNKLLDARTRWVQKVAAAKQRYHDDVAARTQYAHQVRDTWMSGFDITQSGNGSAAGIEASLASALKTNRKSQALINRARAMGLDPRLIRQFEDAGPQGMANLQAIVNQGKGYINRIDAQYAELYGVSTAIGHTAAVNAYQKRLAADTAAIKADTAKERKAQDAVHSEMVKIRKIVQEVSDDLARALERNRKHS